jgi:hypothetical protein
MKRRLLSLWTLLLAAAVGAAPAGDPLGEVAVSSPLGLSAQSLAAAADPAGGAVVAWANHIFDPDAGVRRLDATARPIADAAAAPIGAIEGIHNIAPTAGGFFVTWDNSYGDDDEYCWQIFDSIFAALGAGDCEGLSSPAVASDGAHRLVLAAQEYGGSILGELFDDRGEMRRRWTLVKSGSLSGVAMAPDGRFVVLWSSGRAYYARLFDPAGRPLGQSVTVAAPGDPHPAFAFITVGGDGKFVAHWTDRDGAGAWARLLAFDGAPLPPPILLPSGTRTLARNRAGQMLAVRICGAHFDSLCGQLFDAAGRPAGRELRINRPRGSVGPSPLALALPAGDFLVTWLASDGVRARRVPWLAPGDAPCLQRRSELVCDLRHDGGAAEVRYAFTTQPNDVPLLGDADGDGRDDPCAFRDGRFRCDTAHDGGATEIEIDFGAAGDIPQLGDPDGDRRDDPCVFRDGWFRCDTAHNGGEAEQAIRFGAASDPAFLADVNGDGADEPCVVENGLLLCDTAHDGGTAELILPFDLRSELGDVPLLGDLDGDDRDDPCAVRQGAFLCDAAHAGRFTVTIPFSAAGARPLVGNLAGF